MDNQQKIFPVIDEQGRVVCSATHGECHGGSKLLHPVRPSAEELDGGRFWTLAEIRSALGQDLLTPNFESEFSRFLL